MTLMKSDAKEAVQKLFFVEEGCRLKTRLKKLESCEFVFVNLLRSFELLEDEYDADLLQIEVTTSLL